MSLWAALEALAVPAAVEAEWHALLGADLEAARPFLKATGRAESYPRGDGSEPYAVVEHGPGDLVGVDPETGRSVPLTAGQVAVWGFDRPRLLAAVAAALGVAPDPRPEPAWSRRATVGTFRSPRPRDYPCVYVEARRAEDWAVTAGQLLYEFPEPFVLLTATRRWVPRALEAQLRHQRCALVVLAETLEWAGPGRFRALTPLAATVGDLEARGDAAFGRCGPVLPRHLFRRGQGRVWAVRFAGEAAELPHVMGFAYLARLPAAPGRGFSALELQSPDRGPGVAVAPGLEVLDDETPAIHRERLRRLAGELEDADEFSNAAERERVLAETAALVAELARGQGPRGARTAGGSADRARTAVWHAVRRAIRGKIAPALPGLGTHLERFVTTAGAITYDPDTPVTWEV